MVKNYLGQRGKAKRGVMSNENKYGSSGGDRISALKQAIEPKKKVDEEDEDDYSLDPDIVMTKMRGAFALSCKGQSKVRVDKETR
ncbi:hypothetical protein ACOSQ4_017214 [Xanthoceras sorbifolium]